MTHLSLDDRDSAIRAFAAAARLGIITASEIQSGGIIDDILSLPRL
jgi:hypothetical protein